MAWGQRTGKVGTKHKADCKMVFGRKDATCPRCVELLNGAEARTWNQSADAVRSNEVRNHFQSQKHLSGGCGVVCTFGDW